MQRREICQALITLIELRTMKQSIEARLLEIERLPLCLLAEVFDFDEDTQYA